MAHGSIPYFVASDALIALSTRTSRVLFGSPTEPMMSCSSEVASAGGLAGGLAGVNDKLNADPRVVGKILEHRYDRLDLVDVVVPDAMRRYPRVNDHDVDFVTLDHLRR